MNSTLTLRTLRGGGGQLKTTLYFLGSNPHRDRCGKSWVGHRRRDPCLQLRLSKRFGGVCAQVFTSSKGISPFWALFDGHYCQDWPHWEGRQERHKHQPVGEEGLEESWRAGGSLVKSLHFLPAMVQVSIMEEAGQDVPNWLRGEADRFKNHQVDITLDLRLTMLLA